VGISHLEYAYQESEGGIADALRLAKDFASGDNITVILGDNTTDYDISKDVDNFIDGAEVFLKEVPDPARFGIPYFDDTGRINKIAEKPKNPPNNLAVIGLYIYDKKVFDFIKQVKPSDRGEMEITDVNNFYARTDQLIFKKITGFWRDAGTFETLLEANVFWAKKAKSKDGSK